MLEKRVPSIAHLLNLPNGKTETVAASTAPNPRDKMNIVLIGEFDSHGEPHLFLISPNSNGKRKELFPEKSLRFANHATCLGWQFPAQINQTALAICIQLYGVSNAIKCYRAFAISYLAGLLGHAKNEFIMSLTVEL